MDKRRRYGRKIKKTKNLYRKKRSAGQKIFGTVALIVALSAIAFLGFCIGKPLLDYIGSVGKEKPEEWTPESSYSQQHSVTLSESSDVSGATSGEFAEMNVTTAEVTSVLPESESVTSAAASETTVSQTSETQQTIGTNQPHSTSAQTNIETSIITPSDSTLVSFEAPASALSNRASLAAVLAKAKAAGYNSAVIQLKDRSGYFRYKSGIEEVAGSVLDAGTMTLSDIMSVFNENGMIPIAEIAVLSDNKGCETFPEMSYKCMDSPTISWIEWREQKRWANPESDATREYFAKVTAELSMAGFGHILLTDVVFPEFQPYDSAYIAAKYYAPDRYKMLYNVIKAEQMIEMKASDVVGDGYGRTAECLNDVSQLHGNAVALIISRSDLSTDSGYPADAKTLVETILPLAEKKTPGLNIIPIIDGSGFDDAEKAKISAALISLGYESYIMR
ncbi:MAG: hypothetical protein IK990_07870 [Ruminiclostridium sp.]|nr:hypothetical protein [Ruminiclostridium sp.]